MGHAILFRAVSIDADGDSSRIGFRASTEITLAGHAATRLFASAGAGGIALTAWALKKSGMEARDVAARMTTFMVLLYSVYMGALLFGGLGLYTGDHPGRRLVRPDDRPRDLRRRRDRAGRERAARPAGRVAAAPLAGARSAPACATRAACCAAATPAWSAR